MFKPLSIFIGLRYTRAKRRDHFISFISLTSMLGVALGVAALITVLSVMNGFEKELRGRILGMTSHAFITGADGTLKDWQQLQSTIGDFPHVVDSAPFQSRHNTGRCWCDMRCNHGNFITSGNAHCHSQIFAKNDAKAPWL